MNKILPLLFSFFITSCSYNSFITGEFVDYIPLINIKNTSSVMEERSTIDAQLLWSIDIGESRDFKTGVLQPAFKDDTAYTIDSDGLVTSIDILSGNINWRYNLNLNVSSGLCVHNNMLFFGTNDGNFYGYAINRLMSKYSFLDKINIINMLDKSEIDPDVLIQLKSEASSAAIGVDNLVYIKLDDGDTTAININNSEIEWNYKGRNVPLSIKGSGAIAQYSDNIYIPRDDGNIISLKNDTGKLNWLTTISPRSGRNELESLRDIEMTPIISDGSLFVGSYQGNLVSIDIFTGDIFWTKSMSVLSNLSVDDKNVYVSDNSSNVYAIDKYSGRNIWKTSMNGSVNSTQQFLYDKYTVSLSNEGHIIIIDKANGKLLSFKTLIGDVDLQARGVMRDKILYIASKDGRLNAIKIN